MAASVTAAHLDTGQVRYLALMSDQTVAINLVQRLLHIAESRGQEWGPLLREAGISEEIPHHPQARATLGQMCTLTRLLWINTGDELFGLGPPVPLGTFRVVARSAMGAPDLREMLTRVEEAVRVIQNLPPISVEFGSETVTLVVDPSRLNDPEHLATDTLVAFLHRTISWSIARRVPLERMEMPYDEPRFLRYYEATFGIIPTFGAPRLSFSFAASLLSAPLLRTDEDLEKWIAESPENFFSTRDFGSSTADQVRRVIEQGLNGEWPTAEHVASRLALSVHHVRRLLREEGTSMTLIREDVLRDAAINSLVAGKESVEDLSVRLGFSEASAFRRAFRRWTGMPPGSYREGLIDESGPDAPQDS